MKRKKGIAFLLISIMLLQPPDWINAETIEYHYPIVPGTQEWGMLNSYAEMVEVCSIPKDILNSISTKELIELVMEYPLLSELYLVGANEADGFAVMQMNFNGLAELMERSDLIDVMMDTYKKQDVLKIADDEVFYTIAQTELMELILTDKKVVERMDKSVKQKFADLAYQKYIEKQQSEAYCKESGFVYKIALENGTVDTIAGVIKTSKSTTSTYVLTPKGTKVIVYQYPYLGSEWASKLTSQIVTDYPKARVIYPADNRYNCHSYAWHNSSRSNIFWMNDPSAYWSDGSYRAIGTSPVSGGSKIIYYMTKADGSKKVLHSGNVLSYTSTSSLIISKWGNGPVMQHAMDYVPASYGQNNIYYTSYGC